MGSSHHFVEESLALELVDTNLYRSTKPLWHPPGARGIFGGAVIAQALSAAMKTVDPSLHVHSLHSYFVLAGDSTMPVVYSVEIVRDGRSFATRTVRSLQKGAVIFILTASFHKPEDSPLRHSMPSPVHLIPAPETLHAPTPDEYAKTIYQRIVKASSQTTPEQKVNPIVVRARENGEEFVKSLSEEFASRPIDFRYVHKEQVPADRREGETYRQYVWFKANGAISEDPKVHIVALAYASDHHLLATSLGWQSRWSATDISVMVSLDHSIYFHEEVRMDDWLVYESMSPWTGAARGLNIGYIYSRDGKHVATCVQEGLLRLSDKAKNAKL